MGTNVALHRCEFNLNKQSGLLKPRPPLQISLLTSSLSTWSRLPPLYLSFILSPLNPSIWRLSCHQYRQHRRHRWTLTICVIYELRFPTKTPPKMTPSIKGKLYIHIYSKCPDVIGFRYCTHNLRESKCLSDTTNRFLSFLLCVVLPQDLGDLTGSYWQAYQICILQCSGPRTGVICLDFLDCCQDCSWSQFFFQLSDKPCIHFSAQCCFCCFVICKREIDNLMALGYLSRIKNQRFCPYPDSLHTITLGSKSFPRLSLLVSLMKQIEEDVFIHRSIIYKESWKRFISCFLVLNLWGFRYL